MFVKDIKNRERGSTLVMVLVFSVVFLMLVSVLVSEVLFNWKMYSYVRAKFATQQMVSDILSVMRFEESRELVDGDFDYSYMLRVWEDPNMSLVMKYVPGDNDPYNFLRYYPLGDIANLPGGVTDVYAPVGSFYVSSMNLGSTDLPNIHDVQIVAAVNAPGSFDVYTRMRDMYYNTGYVDASAFPNNSSDISLMLAWENNMNTVIASGNAKEWGEQLRVKGDVWEKPAPSTTVNFKPVKAALNMWELYNPYNSWPFAKGFTRPSPRITSQDHFRISYDSTYTLMDSLIKGEYHYGGQYFTVDMVPFGEGYCDSSRMIVRDTNTICNFTGSGGSYLTIRNRGYDVFGYGPFFRRFAAITFNKRTVKPSEAESVYNSLVSGSSLPWYRMVTDALWNWRWDYIYHIFRWEYHIVNPGLMSPQNIGGMTFGQFYTDVLFPGDSDYYTNDTSMWDVFFTGDSWNDLIRNQELSPVRRAMMNGDYINLAPYGNSFVVTLYTKYVGNELHTFLRYAPGDCVYKQGCSLYGASRDIDLQASSATGEGILIDFGDDAEIFLVTPCQTIRDYWHRAWFPIWEDLCHVAYSPSVLNLGNINRTYLFTDPWGRRFYRINNPGRWLDGYVSYLLLYPDDDINPLAEDPTYNPNWDGYVWTRFVPIREIGFQNYFYRNRQPREINGVKARIYHPNWKNMIQYNFNITMVGKSLRVLGDVIPVPGDIGTGTILKYEVDLAQDPVKNDDIPNASKLPYGYKLGFLLKGYKDASMPGNASTNDPGVGTGIGYSLWFWDKVGRIHYYYYNTSLNPYFDFVNKGNKYGFRFATDNTIYLGKDYKNRWMYADDKDLGSYVNCHGFEIYSWDKLFYADVYIKNGGVGMIYKENYNDNLTSEDSDVWEDENSPYRFPINSETFRLLGAMVMWGGRDVATPVQFTICRDNGVRWTIFDPPQGFSSPIYYLPDNAFSNRVRYWIVSTDEKLANVELQDIRMRR